ncbi:MAG: hypothetical protein AAGG00_07900 [Cyanobacteria bacterium P01_H01_bin.150]
MNKLQSSIELNIAKERLRQARYSFNLAIVATATSFFISLVGAGILLSNNVPQGTVITAVGLVSGVGCTKLANDANDRLDKTSAEEEEN